MINETKRNIEAYKALLPGLKERVAAVALMLVMSVVMMTSATYAWLTISRAPEVQGMNTTITGNGNLEIALADGLITKALLAPGDSKVGDSSATVGKDLLDANITWGNLINLSDARYGLDQVSLRPARFNSYNTTTSPLRGVSYGSDGRVTSTNENYEFASYQETSQGSGTYYFAAGSAVRYGVRAISSVKWSDVVANKTIEDMLALARSYYEDDNTGAISLYSRILGKDVNKVTYVDETRKISCLDALTLLMNIFVNEKAERILGDENYEADYSSVVTYTYRLMVEFMKVLDAEGEALRYLGNIQAYVQDANNGTNYFETIDDLINAKESWLKLESLATYKTSRKNVQEAIDNLKDLAIAHDPDTGTGTDKVTWSQINPSVAKLVDVGTTKINGTPLNNLGGSAALGLVTASKVEVIIYKGSLRDTEQRIGAVMAEAPATKMTVKIEQYNISKTGTVLTDAVGPFSFDNDYGYTAALQPPKNGGTASAKDTYGMALDFWIRTNAKDTTLILEGNVETTQQPVTIEVDGQTYTVYNMTYTTTVEGEEVVTITEVYQKDSKWYSATAHTEIGAVSDMTADGGYTFEEKTIEVVTGYDGVNRVWEDFLKLIEDGYMAENNTTQGNGSCYVFYADPSEQTRILDLLQAFSIEFIDQNGNSYGTAILDTEHAYAINGKVTVPLKMSSGATYLDADGNEKIGITQLEQNTPTWITAIIYLDGLRMSNEDVLAVGNIEGSLNLQFGSSVDLNNQDDEELRNQYRDITAVATSGGQSSNKSTSPISYSYDGTAKTVTVTLTVDGEQPKTVAGFFVRAISATQGTRGDKVTFERQGDIWVATFSISKPGTYVMRNIIVDGVDYALEDGTNKDKDNNIKPENFPTVIISGMQVTSVQTIPGSGVIMTANDYTEVQVIANIAVDPSLLPQQVRAVFVREGDKKEFSAVMRYELQNELNNTAQWVGTAKITEGGKYTLSYVVIDTDFTELSGTQQTKLEVYLGLTAQVWYNGGTDDVVKFDGTTVSYNYDGIERAIPVKMKLYDSDGAEKQRLTNVTLYYGLLGDTGGYSMLDADLTWNASSGYYEGEFMMDTSGTFLFDHVDVQNGTLTSTVSRASSAPTIKVIVTDPPTFDRAETPAQQYKPNSATDPAKFTVVMTNAHTAKVVAQIKNPDTGKLYMVEMAEGDYQQVIGTQYALNFVIPKVNDMQDGNWQLMALYFQNASAPDKTWYPVKDTVTTDNSYVIALEQENITTYAVTKIVVDIMHENPEIGYTNPIVSGVKDGDITGVFMESFNTGRLKVAFKDGLGNPIPEEAITVSMTLSYEMDSSNKTGKYGPYGGYTGAEKQNEPLPMIYENGAFIMKQAADLPFAGVYIATLEYSVFGTKSTETPQRTFEVYTQKPTVTISAITPKGSHTTINTSDNDATVTSKIEGNTATVYCETNRGLNGKITTHPSVTLVLNNMGNAESASLTFTTSNNGAVYMYTGQSMSGQTNAYTWTTGNSSCQRFIGQYRASSSCRGMTRVGAGTLTASVITLTYGGETYTVTIDAITISNPY